MGKYNAEGPGNQFNDVARGAYDAAMDGNQEQYNKGVQIYEHPHLWDEEKPCSIADTPTDNFVPTPTINVGDGFKSFSPLKKTLVIIGAVLATALFLACAITFFADYLKGPVLVGLR